MDAGPGTPLTSAFPEELRDTVASVLSKLPAAHHVLADSFSVEVAGTAVAIPARMYRAEPTEELRAGLDETEQLIVECIYSRHHDGFVRERAIRRMLASGETPLWVVPYVVRLLGEYVVEIAAAIDDLLPPDLPDTYERFVESNPGFLAITEARATSYWSLHYRDQYRRRRDRSDLPVYPAFRALDRIRGAVRTSRCGSRREAWRSVHELADREYAFGNGVGPVDQRITALERAAEMYRSIGHIECATWCVLDHGIITATETSDPRPAYALYTEARDAFAQLGVWNGCGLAVAKLANMAVVRGDAQLARAHLESFAQDLDVLDPTAAASLAAAWADVHQTEGDWTASVLDLEEAVRHYERGRLTHEYLGARVRLGAALLACLRIDEAATQADLAESTLAAARHIDRAGLPRLRANIARARGDLIESVAHLHAALCTDPLQPFDELYIRLEYGELAVRTGQLEHARSELRRAADLALQLDVPSTAARAAHSLATALQELGDLSPALDAALESLRITEQADYVWLETIINRHGTAIEIAMEAGDLTAARELLATIEPLIAKLDAANAAAPGIHAAADAKTALGDELGGRRLRARLT